MNDDDTTVRDTIEIIVQGFVEAVSEDYLIQKLEELLKLRKYMDIVISQEGNFAPSKKGYRRTIWQWEDPDYTLGSSEDMNDEDAAFFERHIKRNEKA